MDGNGLSINFGGNFFAEGLNLGGDLNIKGKDGWDLATLFDSTIGGDVKLDNGDGGLLSESETLSESFLGSNTFLFGVDIAGDLEIKNKDGFDVLQMFDVNVGDDLKVDNGKGGANEFFLFDFDGSVTSLDNVTVGDDLDIKAKDGSDSVELGFVTVDGNTKIKTGKDDDEVRVFDSVFAKFSADGGKDDDLFEDLGGNDFGDGPDLKKFEIIIEDDEEPEPS